MKTKEEYKEDIMRKFRKKKEVEPTELLENVKP